MMLSVLSLNLHGYHPMGERQRWLQNRHGRVRPADSYLHYFSTEELDRGNRRRLDRLAEDLPQLSPDVICLQEVAAGCPWTARDHELFHHPFAKDWFEANSALRLLQRLNDLPEFYQVSLACRGNVGWRTDAATFSQERVITFDGDRHDIVFDFDANPYPDGLLVEGFAVLVRQPWTVSEQQTWSVVTNFKGDRVFVQVVVIRQSEPRSAAWFMIVNVHLGHKLVHFEQAVAIRQQLCEYIHSLPDQDTYAGCLITGDFNASLFRPHSKLVGDLATIAWEIAIAEEFDFQPQGDAFGHLLSGLWDLNFDQHYKPWATIRDGNEAGRRIWEAVERFGQLQCSNHSISLVEAVETARTAHRFQPLSGLTSAAWLPNRIDLMFVDQRLHVQHAGIVYPENDWRSTTGTSDHPGIYATFELSR
jgi:endonuclease/exonuclease/phosphatase family metal-dependent hydrolase